MFYTDLENIYIKKDFLEKKFCFNQYYPLLRNFLAKEVKLGSEFISPYRFAVHYGMSIKDVINFFIALSGETGVFSRFYKLECDCGEYSFLDEKDLSFTCPYCYESDIKVDSNLSNIDLMFKLKDSTLNELRIELKKAQSSSDNIDYQFITSGEEYLSEANANVSLSEIISDPEIMEENPEANYMKMHAISLLRGFVTST